MEHPSNSDSPIFIVGCPRSGTSLLRNLLRSHPNLTFPDESHFIPSYYGRYGDPSDADRARRLAKNLLSVGWVPSWKLDLAPKDFEDCRSFRAVVSRLFEAWARKEGKPRWGDKTPHYVSHIPVLIELFPAARILHIIRDGRDVALSWLRTRMEPGNMYTAARFWRDLVTAGRQAGARLPGGTYMEVRYEALLADPEGAMRGVCAFIGEPYSSVVLRPSVLAPARSRRGRPPKIRKPEIVRGNTTNWKTQMRAADRILFESVAGNLLAELDYETEGRVRRVTVPERWMWSLHHAGKWTLYRMDVWMLRRRLSSFLRIKGAELLSR